MAGSRVISPSYGRCHWKQWWKRSPTCCSKKILLLLVWHLLFYFSWGALAYVLIASDSVYFASIFLSYSFAPLIGWLSDVRFGRYEVIKFGSIASFLSSILCYFAVFNGGFSILSNVLLSIATVVVSIGFACYTAAMLPFLTDQIIGATSDELSTVVHWYYWMQNFGLGASSMIVYYYYYYVVSNLASFLVCSTIIFAVPLAVIIISDCLCQQWLDRTHKVTNPIKLIIQVLNYTRKHRYPERRSAFTYIDEEQPTRMDYGKEKFGGPFTEEEVEDVKTVLRMIPLIICLSLNVNILDMSPTVYLFNDNDIILILNVAIVSWLFPVLLIPLYQLLLYHWFHRYSSNMLHCIGAGLFICALGFILLSALGVVGVIVSDDVQRYLSCTTVSPNATNPGDYTEWYWKLSPCIFYGVGKTIINVLFLEFIIAQSPDKMKGLVMGIALAIHGIVDLIALKFSQFTLCYDLFITMILVVLFVVFLVLSKCYTLRERNREINIQAIVEEHYERYMDQEEEYMRGNPHYFDPIESDNDDDSDTLS